ncbi:MAG TPA: hypothetical protein VGC54_04175 [Planctomycetota bacterium]
MTPTGKYILLSGLSGLARGGVVSVIAGDLIPRVIWGGLIAAPAIGMAPRNWWRLSRPLRVLAALLSLYLATALFGLAVGLYDWMLARPGSESPLASPRA